MGRSHFEVDKDSPVDSVVVEALVHHTEEGEVVSRYYSLAVVVDRKPSSVEVVHTLAAEDSACSATATGLDMVHDVAGSTENIADVAVECALDSEDRQPVGHIRMVCRTQVR